MTIHPELTRAAQDVWPVVDRRAPWRWAEDFIESIPYSPQPGSFRADNSPWIKEPLESLVDEKVKIQFNLASIQTSKTIAAEIGLNYIIANQPGPTLWLDLQDEEAKDQAANRLQVLFQECPPVRSLISTGRKRHQHATRTMRFLNGMQLWVRGAMNIRNLQRRSVRWLIGDETWQWPSGRMKEALARITAFGWLGKAFFMSQGGLVDDDSDLMFKSTDQREWMWKCPHCGTRQAWDFSMLEWSKDAKEADGTWNLDGVLHSTAMRCANEACNHYFADTDRTRRELNLTCVYVPQNPRAPSNRRGYHWNSLCAMSWGELAVIYLEAKLKAKTGDLEDLKTFHQKRLARSWSDDAEDFQISVSPGGYRLGEEWADTGRLGRDGKAVLPGSEGYESAALLIFITADVQQGYFYLTVRAWNWNGSSRLLWLEKIETFEQIDEIQARFHVLSGLVFLDANYNPSMVYRECAKRGWVALIGSPRPVFPHRTKDGRKLQRFYSRRNPIKLGKGSTVNLHYWSNLNIKDILARLVRRQTETIDPFWQLPDDVPEDYRTQMDSERRVKRGSNWIWEQIGKRPNHYWDCEAMQTAAANMLKIVGGATSADTAGTEISPV